MSTTAEGDVKDAEDAAKDATDVRDAAKAALDANLAAIKTAEDDCDSRRGCQD